jgi:predicted ATPase
MLFSGSIPNVTISFHIFLVCEWLYFLISRLFRSMKINFSEMGFPFEQEKVSNSFFNLSNCHPVMITFGIIVDYDLVENNC